MAAGSVNGVFSGKQYNRCIRAHKIAYEALKRLQLQAFLTSLSDDKALEMTCFVEAMSETVHDDELFQDHLNCPLLEDMVLRYSINTFFLNDDFHDLF